jgi:hypothetical protein
MHLNDGQQSHRVPSSRDDYQTILVYNLFSKVKSIHFRLVYWSIGLFVFRGE